jgi:hypothetical protein
VPVMSATWLNRSQRDVTARAALRLPRNARFPTLDEDPEVQALRFLNDA